MRKFISLIAILCFVPLSFSAPADTTSTSTNEKPSVASLTEPAKPVDDKVSTDAKSAGSPEDLDKSRTHSPHKLLLDQVNSITASLQKTNILAPVISPIAAAPVYSSYAYPSYGYGYGYPSKFLPSYGYGSSYVSSLPIQSAPIVAPAVSHSIPVVAPAVHAPVIQPVPVAQPAPVAVSQTVVSKPVVSYNQHVVQQPVYSVSQQVIHKPIYTEILEVVRRPVITEVEEVIHKPVLTELQQVIKKPLYTQHVVKAPSYSSVKQEIQQAPLHVQGESIHVVDKGFSQVVNLPTQVVQPVATHVVQTPVVHQQLATQTSYHVPAVPTVVASKPISSGISYGSYPSFGYGGLGSGYGYGSSYGIGSGYGSSYGIGSGYGSSYGLGSGYGYGSGLSSGYGYGLPYGYSGYGSGLSGISSYGGASDYQYLSPSLSCRATGTCPREAESSDKSVVQDTPAVSPYNWSPMTYSADYSTKYPFSNVFNGAPAFIGQPVYSSLSDQPIFGEKQAQDAQPTQPPQPAMAGKSNEESGTASESSEYIAQLILKDPEAMKTFKGLVQNIKARNAKKDDFDVDQSIEKTKQFARNNPSLWSDTYRSAISPKLEKVEKQTGTEQSKKLADEKKN